MYQRSEEILRITMDGFCPFPLTAVSVHLYNAPSQRSASPAASECPVPAAVTAEVINYTLAALWIWESRLAPARHCQLTDTPLASQYLVNSLAFGDDVSLHACCSLDKCQV